MEWPVDVALARPVTQLPTGPWAYEIKVDGFRALASVDAARVVLRETDPDYVLLDGTLAECDRVGDGRADYSHNTAGTA